jgi:hypothetical protein
MEEAIDAEIRNRLEYDGPMENHVPTPMETVVNDAICRRTEWWGRRLERAYQTIYDHIKGWDETDGETTLIDLSEFSINVEEDRVGWFTDYIDEKLAADYVKSTRWKWDGMVIVFNFFD